jgi:isopenicillin N synthase-like dioxygenase
MEIAFRMLEDISKVIVEAVEMALGLAPSSLLNKITHEKNASEMRILRYPEIELEEIRKGHVSRIWPHFDLGVITLLFQDGVGGLEFEDRTKPGTFLRVDTGARSDLIVNVSETLQRWTNDRIPAGLHQVNVPESLKGRDKGTLPERYSITYFCKADRAASVGPLNDFVESGSMSKYKEMTAIDYHQQRLLSAY